jgi:hypothetical protein
MDSNRSLSVRSPAQLTEIMGDLVAKVAEQGAVGLVHLGAAALAFGVVGFDQGDGDQAVVVAGHYLGAGFRAVGEKIEGEAVFGIVDAVFQRQAQAQQRVEQVVLGGLCFLPARQALLDGEVRDGVVVAASQAECRVAVGGEQPVVGGVLGVVTLAHRGFRCGECSVCVVFGFQGGERHRLRQVAQHVTAGFAPGVLEIDDLAAALAFEQLHVGVPHPSGVRVP